MKTTGKKMNFSLVERGTIIQWPGVAIYGDPDPYTIVVLEVLGIDNEFLDVMTIDKKGLMDRRIAIWTSAKIIE